MKTPSFASLEEAWIDLSSDLDPLYVELLGKDMRDFFYAGATAALTLMVNSRLPRTRKGSQAFRIRGGQAMSDLNLKTRVGNLLVSTVKMSGHGGLRRYFETAVFKCDDKGKVTDWQEVRREMTFLKENADAQHDGAVAWATRASKR